LAWELDLQRIGTPIYLSQVVVVPAVTIYRQYEFYLT
jgi:hypothetical protein